MKIIKYFPYNTGHHIVQQGPCPSEIHAQAEVKTFSACYDSNTNNLISIFSVNIEVTTPRSKALLWKYKVPHRNN